MAFHYQFKQSMLARAVARIGCAALLMHAGAASAIGLMDAYQAALEHDAQYRSAYFANEGGKENKKLGLSNLLPNIGASYSASKNHTDITQAGQITHPIYTSRSEQISLRQALFNLEALARYKQGVAQTNASAAQFDSQKQEVALRLVGAYVELLFKNDQFALAQAERDKYAEQKKVNDRLFEKGEGTRTDSIETQARLDVAESQLLDAKDAQVNAADTLASMIGTEVTQVDGLLEDFRVLPQDQRSFEEWKSIALANNPDVLAQVYGIEYAKQEVNKARSGHFPKLDFVASYSKSTSDTINTIDQDSVQRSIGVQLNIPLFAGGSVNAQTRQAVAGREKAREDLQAQIDKIVIGLHKEYNSLQSSAARIGALVKTVKSGELLLTATEQSIKGGVRINLDLLNAQSQLYTSKRDLAQARYGYLLSILRVRAAAGMLTASDVHDLAAYFR